MAITLIGDAFVDIIAPFDSYRKGNVYNRSFIISMGGTANVASALVRLGIKANFIGAIGNDVFGKFFKSELKKHKINDSTITVDNTTGICISLVHKNKERTMLVDRGSNDFLDYTKLLKINPSTFSETEIVYISGYLFQSETNIKSIIKFSESIKDRCETWFNPGAPNIINKHIVKFIQTYADFLILNKTEAEQITKYRKMNEIVANLKRNIDNFVITDGEDGCYVLTSNMETFINVPAKKVEVVDTTGAGDAFSAGFIAGYVKNKDPIECAKLGNIAAGKIITKMGGC